ncbi:hypothetical protein H8356DRAFT_1024316 [Neocallimastix lanati (nom. inval.)]|nr:hypothetical protein H8356DRAFT_1024316 [Neocallimastix sp. JGI-2020a]
MTNYILDKFQKENADLSSRNNSLIQLLKEKTEEINSIRLTKVKILNFVNSLFTDLISNLKSTIEIEVPDEILTREYEADEIKTLLPQYNINNDAKTNNDYMEGIQNDDDNDELSIIKEKNEKEIESKETCYQFSNNDNVLVNELINNNYNSNVLINNNNSLNMSIPDFEIITKEKEILKDENRKLNEMLEIYKNKLIELEQDNENKKSEIQSRAKSLNHFKSLYCNNKFVIQQLKNDLETMKQEKLEDKKIENEFKEYKQLYNSDRFLIMEHKYKDVLSENQKLHQKIEELSNKYWKRNQETLSALNECQKFKVALLKQQFNTDMPISNNINNFNNDGTTSDSTHNINNESSLMEDIEMEENKNNPIEHNKKELNKNDMINNDVENSDETGFINLSNEVNKIENDKMIISKENNMIKVSSKNMIIGSTSFEINENLLESKKISQKDFGQNKERNDKLDIDSLSEKHINNINDQRI